MARKNGGLSRGRKPSFGDRVESRIVPQSMRIEPRLELCGRGRVLVERHTGLLEYSNERVLVLTADAVLEIGGENLKISAMNRNMLCVAGKIAGVRVLDK